MTDSIHQIHGLVEAMQRSCTHRDREMADMRQIRRGRIIDLYPDLFTDEIPGNIAGNIIDVAARDTAELMAPLPALACASGNMTSNADIRRAGVHNKVGTSYWELSRLALQNINFADSINSYSFGAFIAEADFTHQMPRIRWDNPWGAYYYKDRWGNVIWYAKITYVDCLTLCANYPQYEKEIRTTQYGLARADGELIRLITYMDRKVNVAYLPDCGFLVLARSINPTSRCMVVIAERPDQEERPRGQFDDVKWPVLAKARMAQYMLQAAHKSINAPLAVPSDVSAIPIGPDAVYHTDSPEKVRRINLDIPQDIFVLAQELDRAAKEGARYPEARTGGIQGNIVTGRGVQELMGTMDTQIRTMQTIIGRALEEITSLCFELDVALWPNTPKRITGVQTGKPFELTYTPSRDIGTSYACKVTYGFAAGLSPAQALVALLQLRGDDLISRDTVRRQLPFDVDPEEEQRSVDVQAMEDAAKQGLLGMMQALGPMAAQGQNPVAMLTAAAKAIELRQRGKPVHEALLIAFTPPEPPPGQEPATPPAAPPGQPPGELPPGVRPNGLTQGVPYGQQGYAPGGMPAIEGLLATLRGQGSPRMEASVIRKRAIGAG